MWPEVYLLPLVTKGNGKPLKLIYNAWLSIKGVPLHAWALEQLTYILLGVGLISGSFIPPGCDHI
jgi:hypothetical protein